MTNPRSLLTLLSALVSSPPAAQPAPPRTPAPTAPPPTPRPPRAPHPRVSLPVVAEPVTDGDLVLSVNTTGQVRSDAEGRLRAEVGGPVEKVNVRPGDRVRKGQVLVELDPRPFDLAVQEAQVAVDLAELQHQDNYRPRLGRDRQACRRRDAHRRLGHPFGTRGRARAPRPRQARPRARDDRRTLRRRGGPPDRRRRATGSARARRSRRSSTSRTCGSRRRCSSTTCRSSRSAARR